MPRGRKKSVGSSSAAASRVVTVRREDSEESSSAEDAPKLKDCRLDASAAALLSSPASSPGSKRGPFRSGRITDFYSPLSPASRSPSPPPPVLLPQVPFDPVTMKPLHLSPQRSRRRPGGTSPAPPPAPPSLPPGNSSGGITENDRASDKSEGDSGKENDEDYHPASASATGNKRILSATAIRSKLVEKQPAEPSRVVTRSRATSTKMPLLSLSSSRLNPPELSTPPSSPTKVPGSSSSSTSGSPERGGSRVAASPARSPERVRTRSSSPAKSPVKAHASPDRVGDAKGGDPKSPPTPHKIKLLDEEKKTSSPATAALQKLKKISLSPKTRSGGVKAQDEKLADAASIGPKKNKSKQIRNEAVKTLFAEEKEPDSVKRQPNAVKATVSKGTSNGTVISSKTKTKLAAAAASSHKVTDYFSVRRSQRAKHPTNGKRRSPDEPTPDIEVALARGHDRDNGLAVCDFAEKGRGVVAERGFQRGEFVVEYAGDLIDVCEAKQRESDYSMDLSTGCYMYYFKHKGKQYCIDATEETERLGRLVNHSRVHPNLQTKVVTFMEKPRLILVARKEVAKGEELLYDYGDRSKESLKAHPWLSL